MFKNTASQKAYVFAFDTTTGLPKTGDQANITAYVQKDYGSATVLTDTSATQVDATNAAGYYLFDLSQAETNADTLAITAKSVTANIVVVGVPAVIFTVQAAVNSDVAAIKAQTDKFVFTVSNEVNANTRYIKGQAILGAGSSGDPWHP